VMMAVFPLSFIIVLLVDVHSARAKFIYIFWGFSITAPYVSLRAS